MALIEREAALKVLEAWPQLLEKLGVTLSPQANDMLTDCIRAICGVKAIDAAPAVHGRWEPVPGRDGGIDFRCTACHGYRFHNAAMRKKYHFCPNCGALMGGEDGG